MRKYKALELSAKENLEQTLGNILGDIQIGDLDLADYMVVRNVGATLSRLGGGMERIAARMETLLSRVGDKRYEVGEAREE